MTNYPQCPKCGKPTDTGFKCCMNSLARTLRQFYIVLTGKKVGKKVPHVYKGLTEAQFRSLITARDNGTLKIRIVEEDDANIQKKK